MEYLSVAEAAKKWALSERSIRNYANNARIVGAKREGRAWLIPANAKKPQRKNGKSDTSRSLLAILQEEKQGNKSGGIYHKVQIELTYNSNHLEGSELTRDQTRYIYETNTIGIDASVVNVDDIVETANHFRCIDRVIEQATQSLSEKFIKELHFTLKNGTSDLRKEWFTVGDYKRFPNEAGGRETVVPEEVPEAMKKLLASYHQQKVKSFEEIVAFHYEFEVIHPFQDGNGRIGRLILFKELLRNHHVPFIIDEKLKAFYYRGLAEWKHEPRFLFETCLAAQDTFKTYLDYFRIDEA